MGLKLAYLIDHYPAVSHTFILREVEALRRLGVEVETMSLHDSADQVLSEADRRAYETTFAISLRRWRQLLVAHCRALVSSPGRYLGVLRRALSLARHTPQGRKWGVMYFGEAVSIWHECRRRGVRHIHAQFTAPAPDVALLAAEVGGGEAAGWSWSFTAHGSDIYQTSRELLAEKIRRARFVMAVSDFGRAQLMMLVDESHWPKFGVVHCGLTSDAFRPVARSSSSGSGSFHVLSVGRLASEKGQAVLLEALAILRGRGVDARVTLIGDGGKRSELEAIAAQLELGDAVTFAGRIGQDDIGSYYAAADVFCLPSFAEGIPVVLMEAMAMELPVVASGIMGIPELVEQERSGLLVPPGRPDLIADALGRLAADAELRAEMGRRGRAKVLAEFDSDVCAAQLRDIFERRLAAAGNATLAAAAGTPAGGPSETAAVAVAADAD